MKKDVVTPLVKLATISVATWVTIMAIFLKHDYDYAMKHNSAACEWEVNNGRS